MATSSGVNEQRELCPSWDDLPTDILLLLFENMPASSLAVCMFVSQTWRNHVEHVLEVKQRWEELFDVTDFKIKCKTSLKSRQMYYNYILWHSFQNAIINLHAVQKLNVVKKIHTYKDNLIIVKNENVQCCDAKTLNVLSTMECSECVDFLVNDMMAVEVFKQDKYLKLRLLIRLHSNAICTTQSRAITVYDVVCYKVHTNECYVLDNRNYHTKYNIVDGQWQKKFIARYYGCPDDTCAMNVIDDQVYLLLRGGFVLLLDENNGHFTKMTRISTCKRRGFNDRRISRISDDSEVIHRKIFLWCCMHDFKEKYLTRPAGVKDELALLLCSRKAEDGTNIRNERYTPWSNPINKSDIFYCKIQNVSCMFLHSDILFLGHLDGTVELIRSKDLSKDLSNTIPLRRFNVKDFKDIADPAVLSIDVYEEEYIQHLFIVTDSHVLHLHISHHTNCKNYMWNEEAYKSVTFVSKRVT